MEFNGFHTFHAPRKRVFTALFNPEILKATIPNCEDVWYAGVNDMKIRLVTFLPSFTGPYVITVRVMESQEPDMLVLQAGRSGPLGGTINTMTHLKLTEENNNTLLMYATTVELEGPVAAIDNPVFQEVARHSLKAFFEGLDAALAP
jgi:carbon monoxide dehydrogenase subunit G